MTYAEACRLVAVVQAIWPHQRLATETPKVWHPLLEGFTLADAEASVRELAAEGREWPPPVGVIVKTLADRATEIPEWDEVWHEVHGLIRRYGSYRLPPEEAFSHPVVAAFAPAGVARAMRCARSRNQWARHAQGPAARGVQGAARESSARYRPGGHRSATPRWPATAPGRSSARTSSQQGGRVTERCSACGRPLLWDSDAFRCCNPRRATGPQDLAATSRPQGRNGRRRSAPMGAGHRAGLLTGGGGSILWVSESCHCALADFSPRRDKSRGCGFCEAAGGRARAASRALAGFKDGTGSRVGEGER